MGELDRPLVGSMDRLEHASAGRLYVGRGMAQQKALYLRIPRRLSDFLGRSVESVEQGRRIRWIQYRAMEHQQAATFGQADQIW